MSDLLNKIMQIEASKPYIDYNNYHKGNIFGIEPPNFVVLQVTQTDPGFAGNTATNATKPATLETGAEIKVPLFIEEGEMINVDTRTGEDMSRA